jgi:hypothetical protein
MVYNEITTTEGTLMEETTDITEATEEDERGRAFAIAGMVVCGFAAYGLYTAVTKVGHKVLDLRLSRKVKAIETAEK